MPIIARPDRQPLSRWDDAVPAGATLRLAKGERAVLVFGGAELAVLGMGDTVLSAQALPALAPAIEGDDVEAELWFTGTETLERKFAARLPFSDAASGISGELAVGATFRLRVGAPERTVLACIDDGPESLGEKIDPLLDGAVKSVLGQIPLPSLAGGLPPSASQQLASGASQALSALGLEVVEVLQLSAELDARSADALRKRGVPASSPGGGAAAGLSCGACGAQGVSGKFCPECGQPLAAGPQPCRGCGEALPPGAKFCGACGAPQGG